MSFWQYSYSFLWNLHNQPANKTAKSQFNWSMIWLVLHLQLTLRTHLPYEAWAHTNLLSRKKICTKLLFEGGNSRRPWRLGAEALTRHRQALRDSTGLQTPRLKELTPRSHGDIRVGIAAWQPVPAMGWKQGCEIAHLGSDYFPLNFNGAKLCSKRLPLQKC